MRKTKLFALLMAFTAVGGLAATGAFTTVEAERTADVNVAGDANALLAIQPTEDQENSSFINQDNTEDSTFEIVLDEGGVNANATTTAENIFNITNNGEEDVDVWIATEGGAQEGNNSVNTTFYIAESNVGSEVKTTSDGVVNISQRIDTYDALVDNGDVVISESTGSPGESPSSTAGNIAVNVESGQTVTVSMAIEIEDESDIDLSNTDEPILEDIIILAVNDDENGQTDITEGTTTTSGS